MDTAMVSKQTWTDSFREQIAKQAYNTAPVEALVRTISYHFRDRYTQEELTNLHFLEMGCGAAPNLLWLAQKGIWVSGLDIAANALELARASFQHFGVSDKLKSLVEGSVTSAPFPDESFDGILESCVFQHLQREDREKAFSEVGRLLKPGGIFVGYMLDVGHSTYVKECAREMSDDPGTLMLQDGTSKVHLTNIGLAHFFRKEEFSQLLSGFSVVDPCLTSYYLPKAEAAKRGYSEYLQSMWIVFAVK